MKKLSEIFNYWYGVNLEYINCIEDNNGIPFVSRTSKNNGVVGKVQPVAGIMPNPSHTLSLACGGSVLSCFYQDAPYYSGRDLFVLSPKNPMTKEQLIFYSYVISFNRYKYNYGRQANKTFKDLLLPELNEIEYLFTVDITADFVLNSSCVSLNNVSLDTTTWKWFRLGDIIERPYKAKAYNAQDLTFVENNAPNAIRYVTRTDENNGIKGFVKNENFVDFEDGNAIIIGDTTATIYYQDSDFICGDHIVVIRFPQMNKYNGLFLVTILNQERFRYCYGKSYKKDSISNTMIKLPSDSNGNPDLEFMENYIKSMPFSSNI
ncbi:MAG: restriction endonuclease subunit S [Muribaculaceae bacterium]|nr:restriction endonuclease subunit S [Muribaculaceae bacterium]